MHCGAEPILVGLEVCWEAEPIPRTISCQIPCYRSPYEGVVTESSRLTHICRMLLSGELALRGTIARRMSQSCAMPMFLRLLTDVEGYAWVLP
jgi:hypothetical protein